MTTLSRVVQKGVCVGIGLVLVFGLADQGYAQATTGTISGTVADASGAVIPGAAVSAVNLDTGVSRSTVSDQGGRYTLPNLSLGRYEVRSVLQGFREAVRSGITLTVGRHAVVDLVMAVGDLTEEVVVTGEAALVETSDAELGGLVSERQIRDLPLNSRSFTDLALFQPGVKLSRQTGTAGITDAGFGTMMSVSGARPENNVFKLDGTDISDVWQRGTGGVTQAALGVEAVREFQVLTHNYGAEQGKFSGGVVNVVTRSGTNVWHGSVFGFHRNDKLDAPNYFDVGEKPRFRRYQFGSAAGGPIVRDRTFVFGNYEGMRDRLGSTERARVPTAAARQGLLQNPSTGAFVPVQINPKVAPYLKLWPLPTPGGIDFRDGTAEYIWEAHTPSVQDYAAVRVDHTLSDRNSLFGRYTFTEGSRVAPAFHALTAADLFNRNQYVTIEDKHVVSPRLLTVVRLGYSRTHIGEVPVVLDPAAADPSLVLVPGKLIATMSPSGVSAVGAGDAIPEIFTKNLFEATSQVIYSAGRHNVKLGGQLQLEQQNIIFETRQNSRWSFPSLRDFLGGTNVNRMEMAPPEFADPHKAWRQRYAGFFVQDDFKMRSNLTINLGLRAERTTNLVDKQRRMSFLPESRLRDGSNKDLVIGEDWYKNPGLHVAPRLGFAWDARGTGSSVLRGGFGVYYDHIIPASHTIGAWRMFPFYNVIAATRLPDGSPLPFPTTADQMVALFGAESKQVWQFQYEPEKIRSLHYSLGWQQQLPGSLVVKLGYVGTRAANVLALDRTNEAQPVGFTPEGHPLFGPSPQPRPNPNFEIIDIISTDADAWYHGMDVELSKRFSGGFQFQGSYTLSKMIDTAGGVRTGGGDPSAVFRRDFVDLTLRGLAPFDVRHNFSFNTTLQLPSPSGGALRAVLGGWQVNSLLMMASGQPFTVTQGQPAGDQKGIYRPDLADGADMRAAIRGGPDQYFDPSIFLYSDSRRFGNVGRNTLLGPGLFTLDFSLNKEFALRKISEQAKIQLRSEFFNASNRANFRQPDSSVFNGRGAPNLAAGRISSTTTTARQIQFGVKFLF